MENHKYNSTVYSVYAMDHNNYLGDCITVVYKASQNEVLENGLTNENIIILIKPLYRIDIDQKNFELTELIKILFDPQRELLLRIGSECLLGVFGDSHCDCESQRVASLNAIRVSGQGIYVHMPQEAQGWGLHYKAQELSLQVTGHNNKGTYIGKQSISSASKLLLGDQKLDIRSYSILRKIFNDIGLNKYSYKLITSNPKKIQETAGIIGINITDIINVKREITPENIAEYLGKLYSKNYHINSVELDTIINLLETSSEVPERVYVQLAYIKQDYGDGRDFGLDDDQMARLIKFAPKSIPTVDNMVYFNAKMQKDTSQQIDLSVNVESEQIEMGYSTSSDIFDELEEILGKKYIDYTAFESKKYFDIDGDVLQSIGREIKIRTTTNIVGMPSKITRRLIYKSTTDNETESKIVNISLDSNHYNDNLLMPMCTQVSEQESISHICKIQPNLILVIKVLPMYEYLLDIFGDASNIYDFIHKLESKSKIKKVDINSFEKSYGVVSRFSEKQLTDISKREKSIALKHLKSRISLKDVLYNLITK